MALDLPMARAASEQRLNGNLPLKTTSPLKEGLLRFVERDDLDRNLHRL